MRVQVIGGMRDRGRADRGQADRDQAGRRAGRVPGRAVLALACTLATPAAASGSFECNVEDKAVSVTAAAAFSHGFGEALNNFRASVELKARPPGATTPAAPLELDAQALVHHWLHGRELKLRLYHEGPETPGAALELVIETRRQAGDETAYAGRYHLTITEPGKDGAPARERSYKGRASCSVG
ncbi:hypothetical protein ACI7BZ_01520 [Xanthobacter sp. AM11]|uniref:hypothetical protein n=1 Tax=Xanthobacter sp. AM11 TaxID=3380643 RepID=UPI0039BFC5F9